MEERACRAMNESVVKGGVTVEGESRYVGKIGGRQ